VLTVPATRPPAIVDLAPGIRWSAGERATLLSIGRYRQAPRRPVTVEQAVCLLGEADLAVLPPLRGRFGPGAFAATPRLRGIATCTTNTAWLDLAAARAAGIAVRPLRTYGAPSVAEWVFATLLYETRRLGVVVGAGPGDRDACRGVDLYGKTVGIIGAGAIGRRCAEIARGFGMDVLVHNRTTVPGLSHCPVDELLRRSDVVIVSIASTGDTRGIINRAAMASCRPHAVVISVSRQDVVDVEALCALAGDGRIARFVFELDDPVDEADAARFAEMPRVLATRHIAWFTDEAHQRERAEIIANLRALAAGGDEEPDTQQDRRNGT